MIISTATFEVYPINASDEIIKLEEAGRTCYKSTQKETLEDSKKFITGRIRAGHESIIEHTNITVCIICDRGVSHEIVRHRLASYSQESTRYCNYKKTDAIEVIKPCFFPEIPLGEFTPKDFDIYTKLSNKSQQWFEAMLQAEESYMFLINEGCTPQEARSVLPNSLKTEIVMTCNLREWRHFFKLRALGLSGKPHPQMLEIAIPMLKVFNTILPSIFQDLYDQLPK